MKTALRQKGSKEPYFQHPDRQSSSYSPCSSRNLSKNPTGFYRIAFPVAPLADALDPVHTHSQHTYPLPVVGNALHQAAPLTVFASQPAHKPLARPHPLLLLCPWVLILVWPSVSVFDRSRSRWRWWRLVGLLRWLHQWFCLSWKGSCYFHFPRWAQLRSQPGFRGWLSRG